jgi:ABC-type lipoprotein release transport system permease subunit
MQPLAFKMLLRKKGVASAIAAVALLVALLASVDCLVNNINSQTTLMTKLANSGDTYLIVSKDFTCLSDSKVEASLVCQIRNFSNVKSAVYIRLIQANVERNSENYTVGAVGVDDLAGYLSMYNAYVNGSISQNSSQVNVGVVLANLFSIEKNNLLNVTVNGKTCALSVAGTLRVSAQCDAQLLIPLEVLDRLQETDDSSGYIEFAVADANQAEATLSSISQILPSDTQIVTTQKVTTFASDINNQIVQFIGVWSIAVYAVVAAASYVLTARIVSEAKYELDMLSVLGAKSQLRFIMILSYGLIIVFAGSVLGVSLGVVGAQVVSSAVRWVWGNSFLAPFLELDQVFRILLLSSAAALLGCLIPAYRAGYRIHGGSPL